MQEIKVKSPKVKGIDEIPLNLLKSVLTPEDLKRHLRATDGNDGLDGKDGLDE